MTHRVYLPGSPALLRRLVETGRIGPAPLAGHSVTDAARVELGGQQVTDEEELEYAVATAASLESLSHLADDDVPRRVVVAVDVARVRPGEGGASAVLVPDEVPLKRVAAVLVDDGDAEDDVAAARVGSEAEVDRCLNHELGWYARQELPAVVEGPVEGLVEGLGRP